MKCRKRLLSGAASMALLGFIVTSPGAAFGGDTPVSDPGGQGERASITAPDPGVPDGEPFTGLGTISEADVVESGAKRVQEELEVESLHPDMAARTEAAPETVLGWDSRMRFDTSNYPNRAIVYISYNGFHLCSGFMVSSDTVITSGHCLHTGGSFGSWRDRSNFEIYPGRDGSSAPYGSCGATRLHSVLGWTNDARPEYDYGAIKLDCNIGSTVGWFGVYRISGAQARHGPTRVIGYPGDKSQEQWGASDKLRRIETRMLCYRDDTTGGVSGSALWNDRGYALANTGAWAFGVHGYGSGGSVCGGSSSEMNGAKRLTGPALRNIRRWRD